METAIELLTNIIERLKLSLFENKEDLKRQHPGSDLYIYIKKQIDKDEKTLSYFQITLNTLKNFKSE